jgi:NAD(P)-dependent dehydrogenase (short-subunit alcohol dehydrogenase family)
LSFSQFFKLFNLVPFPFLSFNSSVKIFNMSSQTQKYNKLAGAHVLVIGGSSGIGYAVAEASLAAGASVTISSSNPSRVAEKVKALQTDFPSGKVSGYACDLSKDTLEQDIEALFKQVGQVDHIIFTAGDALSTIPLSDLTLPKMKSAGQIRFFAPLLVSKIGSRYLTPGPRSSIILTGGSVAEHPMPNWSIVASFASGLHGMVRNLALDLKPVRVNLVQPGAVETNLWAGMPREHREAMFKGMTEKFPTGRVTGPEDVAETYLWLMKDWNVTGTVARSDSGASLV